MLVLLHVVVVVNLCEYLEFLFLDFFLQVFLHLFPIFHFAFRVRNYLSQDLRIDSREFDLPDVDKKLGNSAINMDLLNFDNRAEKT